MHTAKGRTFFDRASRQEYHVRAGMYEEESHGETRRVWALVFTNTAGDWKGVAVHPSVVLGELTDEELEELLAHAR